MPEHPRIVFRGTRLMWYEIIYLIFKESVNGICVHYDAVIGKLNRSIKYCL